MEEKTIIPESVINDAIFVFNNEPELKAAKERLNAWISEHGMILLHDVDIQVLRVERVLKSINEDKISDYRKGNLANFTKELITASNVLDIIGQRTIDAAGLGYKDCPEIYDTRISTSVKVSSIPKDRRKA